MKLFIIAILFWHGAQTRVVSVIGQTTPELCVRHIKSENGKSDYTAPDGHSSTVFTCVDGRTLHAIQDGTVSVDVAGNVEKEENL